VTAAEIDLDAEMGDEPTDRPARTKTRTGWVTNHDRDCWRLHPMCALVAARDLHLSAREHHAGQAEVFARALSTARRARHGAVPAPAVADTVRILAAARKLLAGRDASVRRR